MSYRKKEQGIEIIARCLRRNLGLNGTLAKVEARRVRDRWHEALLRGEPVEVPGLELQVVWGQQKQQLQPVPPGRLKNIGKTPIRLVEPGNGLKMSSRSMVFFEFGDKGNVKQVAKRLDRSRRLKWTPGNSKPEQKVSQRDTLVSKSSVPAQPGPASAVSPRPLPQVLPVESLRHQRQIIGSRTAMFRQNPRGRR